MNSPQSRLPPSSRIPYYGGQVAPSHPLATSAKDTEDTKNRKLNRKDAKAAKDGSLYRSKRRDGSGDRKPEQLRLLCPFVSFCKKSVFAAFASFLLDFLFFVSSVSLWWNLFRSEFVCQVLFGGS
jgi:hypothetical protein